VNPKTRRTRHEKDLPLFEEAAERVKAAQQEGCGNHSVAVVPAALHDLDPFSIRPIPEGAILAPHLFQQIEE